MRRKAASRLCGALIKRNGLYTHGGATRSTRDTEPIRTEYVLMRMQYSSWPALGKGDSVPVFRIRSLLRHEMIIQDAGVTPWHHCYQDRWGHEPEGTMNALSMHQLLGSYSIREQVIYMRS